MIARRLSNEALYLVLACLVLGTLVMAQATLRAYASVDAGPGPSTCLHVAACSTSQSGVLQTPSRAGATSAGPIQAKDIAPALRRPA